MRLEYLPDCPLIRLFDLTPAEAASLGAAITERATGRADRIAVHSLPGTAPISGCELLLLCRSWDQGVVRVGPSAFEYAFTAGTWDNVAGLVEPFASDRGGYQWLARGPGEASWLLSASGLW